MNDNCTICEQPIEERARDRCRRCVECHRMHRNARQRQRYADDPEYRKRKSMQVATNQNRWKTALRKARFQARKHGYEPCHASPDELKASFSGVCQNPGCGVSEEDLPRRLSMDHCHKTGAFRGWLCSSCNKAAGLLRDDFNTVRGLAIYLEEHDG